MHECLYLGSAKSARNDEALKALGIKHVLNVTDDIPNYFENNGKEGLNSYFWFIDNPNIKYENIFIQDTEDAPINLYFDKAYDFIDRTLFKDEDGNPSFEISNKLSSEFEDTPSETHESLYTQTLKLDLGKGTIEECDTCEPKKLAYQCDLEVLRLRKLNNKPKLLVHCAMGKSRSATIVIMYLMKKFLLPYKIAKSIVKSRRETIEVNSGFISQLKAFEQNDFKFSVELSDGDSDSTEGEENINFRLI